MKQVIFYDFQGEVSYILYSEAGLMVALFLLMVAYFPDSPPTPPSGQYNYVFDATIFNGSKGELFNFVNFHVK